MILHSKFRPSWWLSNPHLQTIWASKCRRHKRFQTISERLELPDGDFVDLSWSAKTEGPIVCLFHGLTGCIDSAYINGLIPYLENTGFRPLFMHFRGCSGEPNRLASSYHSGHTDDIRFLIQTVNQRFPEECIHAVGFSLGGNALLKYLGEEGKLSPLVSAIAVSPPLVLDEGARRMNIGASRIYQWHLLKQMRRQHELRRTKYPEHRLPEATAALDTFWEFDDKITAKINGFDGVNDYYSRCSARQFLQKVSVPTHIIHSRDDPFFSEAVIPAEDELSLAVTLELCQQGGHVAFITGSNPLRPEFWLEPRIAHLLTQASGLTKGTSV